MNFETKTLSFKYRYNHMFALSLSQIITQYNSLRSQQNALIQKRDRCFCASERAIIQAKIMAIDTQVRQTRSLLKPIKLKSRDQQDELNE